MDDHNLDSPLRTFTATIVAAYIGRNPTPLDQLPGVISTVHDALAGLGQPTVVAPVETAKAAVPIRKSITPDFIVCLDCGQRSKMLKRHLMTAHGLTPDEYRHKWGLSRDYPMTAPNYTNERSALAKQIGLGRGGRAIAAPETPPATPPAPPAASGKAGSDKTGSSKTDATGKPARRGRRQPAGEAAPASA
jgi:predicted transcriptional regulator